MRTLGILVALALLAVIAAWWLSAEREPATGVDIEGYAFPALRERVNDITYLQIAAAGEEPVRLSRQNDQWQVINRSGYPADAAKLIGKLRSLAQAEVLELKTSNPEMYDRLGVEDPDQDDAASTILTLGETDAIEIVIGDGVSRAERATFVRRRSEAQSFLASGDLSLDTSPEDWLAKEIVDISAAEIASVLVEPAEGERIELRKDNREQTDFSVVNVPEDRELRVATAGNAIGAALAGLNLEDVRAREGFDIPEQVHRLEFLRFDGLKLAVVAFEAEDNQWLTFDVSAESPPAVQAEETESDLESTQQLEGTSPAAGDEEAEESAQEDDVAGSDEGDTPPAEPPVALAQELHDRLSRWVFAIPTFKYSNFDKQLEDLLAPVETEAETEDS